MNERHIRFARATVLSVALAGAWGTGAQAVQIELVEVASGLDSPVDISHASDGSDRLFIVEQAGRIRIHDGTAIVPTPFLDISDRVRCCGERGLLGLAFHPDYGSNGWLYVNYTGTDGDTRVSRFTVSDTDPNVADPRSEMVLLVIDQPFSNHNGGDLAFGPDGYLYVPTGDGGSGGDPGNRAQDPASLLGKVLRLDVNGPPPYAIPPDNPFVGDPDTLDEIWALGLRNPWRASFDRLTGDLWIADVGQSDLEEVNVQPGASTGGENYGWRCYQGSETYDDTVGCGPPEDYQFPIYEYSHAEGCSVTGGYVYRGTRNPDLRGHYLFTDYCSGSTWSTVADGAGGWATDPTEPSSLGFGFVTFGEDAAGELYTANLDGSVYRVDGVCPGFALESSASDESAPGAADGSIDLTIANGTAPFDVAWSTGATTEDLGDLTAGTYTVAVTDAAGCTLSEAVVLNECGPPTNVRVLGRTASTVQLAWSHENAFPYAVYHDCLTCQGTGPMLAPAPVNAVNLTGLEACSVYASVVLAVCPNQQVLTSVPLPFATAGCP